MEPMTEKDAAAILEEAKRRKVAYCEKNGQPVPAFDKAEDFLIRTPQERSTWVQVWRHNLCGAVWEDTPGTGQLPKICPACLARIDSNERRNNHEKRKRTD